MSRRRLNDHGQLLSAVGDGRPAIDGVVFGSGGAPQWEYRDGRSVLYNGHAPDGSGWALLRYTVATGKTDIVDPVGGSFLAVSEGRWANQTPQGLRANVAFTPGSVMSLTGTDGRGASGPAGEIALCSDQSCTAFDIYAPGGHVEHVGGVAYGLCLLDATRAIWTNGGAHNYALQTARPLRDPQLVTIGAEDWIVGWADGVGLLAQINGAADGYVLASDGSEFDFDARAVNGDLLVAWSTGQGEAPGQDRKVVVDRTQPRTALGAAPTPVVPPVTTPPATPSTLTALSAHPRKLWIAPYYAFGTHGDTPRDQFLTVGNAAVLVGDARDPNAIVGELARVYALGLPLIVAESPAAVVAPYLGSIVAWLASGASIADLEASVARAQALPEKPILAYLDQGTDAAWPVARPSGWTDRVWPSAQAYRQAGETTPAFSDRIGRMLTRVANWGGYCSLTPRWDDVNGTQPVSFVLECVPVYADLVQRFPVCTVMAFAANRGAQNLASNQDLLAAAQAFSRANVARPNRYDYWTPAGSDPAATLRNKIGQTTELTVLSPTERAYVLARLG